MADKDTHYLQWLKNESEWYGKSDSKDDIWDRRAQSCTNLLSKFK